ncbi:hypothetical protein QAD02_007040 [Eretmocerus hayati]|uniref:Uncharacterized protein n=1 Tax=Eretmocerus hayati TaxID=131215 RepID=A0ACC2N2K6_9HYME|nr:hypothetical protein QAD02_007040 [Eretmocerus hayati]
MTPVSVTLYNATEARENMKKFYGSAPYKQPKYSVGDLVRVSRRSGPFAKAYSGGWTTELFKIVRISETRTPCNYFLHDLDDEEIDGFFYEEELSRVRMDLNSGVFEIDNVLRSRGKGRKKEFFVSWKGYPEKFNSLVPADNLQRIP